MKVIVKSHTVTEEILIVSGHIGKKTNPFDNLEVKIDRLIEFIQQEIPNYIAKFCSVEASDYGDIDYWEVFDKERMLDEIDYGILAEYIIEANLLNR